MASMSGTVASTEGKPAVRKVTKAGEFCEARCDERAGARSSGAQVSSRAVGEGEGGRRAMTVSDGAEGGGEGGEGAHLLLLGRKGLAKVLGHGVLVVV